MYPVLTQKDKNTTINKLCIQLEAYCFICKHKTNWKQISETNIKTQKFTNFQKCMHLESVFAGRIGNL